MLISEARETEVEGFGDGSLKIEACTAESVASTDPGPVSKHLLRLADDGLVESTTNTFDDTDKESSV